MRGHLYIVTVARDEKSARLGERRVFVELACGYHALFYEVSRQLSGFAFRKSISYGRERDSLHGGNSR